MEIPKIVLDPRSDEELIEQAFIRVSEASQGKLTDFEPGSIVSSLITGQVFCQAELLWLLNQLPEATALEVFRLYGVYRLDGTVAKGSVTFQLQSALSSDFIVSAGYLIPWQDSYLVTQDTLVIPGGSLTSTVAVVCQEVGSKYNIPAYELNVSGTGLAYLQSIYNTEAITGGTDLEDLTDTIIRGIRATRSKQVLVSSLDYEVAAQEILGTGSKADCIPLLSANKLDKSPGQVHLFLANADGSPATTSTCQIVKQQLVSRVFAGSDLWVSPYKENLLQIEVVVRSSYISEELARSIDNALKNYLKPSSYPIGSTLVITEIAYVVRSLPNILLVDDVVINGYSQNYPMDTEYSRPTMDTSIITLVDQLGNSQTYYFGISTGDPD